MKKIIESISMYGDIIEITYTDKTKEQRQYMESKKGLYTRAEYQVHELTNERETS